MKKVLLTLFLASIMLGAFAQERQISGKITDSQGEAVPGANVIVKGTTIGTTTDLDGNYKLSVPGESETLVFSFIGMQTQEVAIGSRAIIDMSMSSDVQQLAEVVVTALGIERDSKRLGYATTTLKNEDLTKGRSISPLNALQGKVAGVNITQGSGQPGSSTNVILRGMSSLGSNNQPLYVVDGVPVNNTQLTTNTVFSNGDFVGGIGSQGLNGGLDFGNRGNDINPNDIESITVLKSASATALYGSRAANGAIIVTTKKGKKTATEGRKFQVDVSSSTVFQSVLRLPDFQNTYGQGFFGTTDPVEQTSWGPKFDGVVRPWGEVVDNSQLIKPYSALPNNVKDFFNIGKTFTNNVSFSGGTDYSTFYMSYSNTNANGIFPTDADSYNRNTLSFRANSNLTDRFTAGFSANYVKKNSSFISTGQNSATYDELLQTPRDIPVVEAKDFNDPFFNLDNYYSYYSVNPYFVLNNNGNEFNEDRVYGNMNLNYQVSDAVGVTWRVGGDVSNSQLSTWRAILQPTPGSPNDGISSEDPGAVGEQAFHNFEVNSDLMVNISVPLTRDIDFGGLIGYNVNMQRSDANYASVAGLDIPGFYQISNSSASPAVTQSTVERNIVGAYAQIDLDFRDYLFLTVGARNDWSSTLPKENRSFFYPSVNTSFVFTEALGISDNILSYGKIRAGWAQAGNDAKPYQILPVFVPAGVSDGFRSLNFPLPGGTQVNGFEVSNIIGSPDLQPEITTEIEVGFELGFFQQRLNFDVSLYDKSIKDLIWNATLPRSTGYTAQTVNLGEITNRGIEALMTATPIRTGSFQWDVSVNFTKNDNKLVSLTDGLDEITLGGLGGNGVNLIARPGEPVGLLNARGPKTTDDGRIIVGSDGKPVYGEREVIGQAAHDWTAGLSTGLTFKGFTVSGTLDVRKGGLFYSRSASLTQFSGTSVVTQYNDRKPFIVPNSVQEVVDGDNVTYVENATPITQDNLYSYWNDGGMDKDEAHVLTRSFTKLRELSVSYNLPSNVVSKTPFKQVRLALVGRNLFLWTPSSNRFADPESTTFNDGQGLSSSFGEFGATPSTRSYGFDLRVTL
ncbi:MAG: SusC/RagA family TonB-linked outer membrane protein [Cyclobacteriaceae bacterium]